VKECVNGAGLRANAASCGGGGQREEGGASLKAESES
jgi:hypothetical protein